jgi:dipeptide/tripeptide permease
MEATAQSLAGAAQAGLGFGIGALIAGTLWDLTNGHVVLFACAAGMALGGVIFWLGNRHAL